MGLDIDYRRFERSLDQIGKKALPAAATGYLNGIAFAARDQLIKHNSEAFNGHVKFTDRAWVVDKARPDRGANGYAVVKALPAQAEYLKFQIEGGTRRRGDAGSGPYDLMVFGAKTNRAGNIRWGYPKQLSRQNREEKAARSSLRSQRDAARSMDGDLTNLSWVKSKRNRPGIFFGEVGGVEGYWQRPKRTKAARKRLKGVKSVRTTEKIKPLLTVSEFARYKPRFKYDLQISSALSSAGSSASFNSEFQRALSKVSRG